MLGHPALVLRLVGGDAQGEALLAEQDVAAVARVDRPDGVVLGELDDVAVLLLHLGLGVQAADKVVGGVAELVERLLAHAGHDVHVEHDVDRVGQLNAHLGEGGADRAHAVGEDIHGAALHRTVEEGAQLGVHDLRVLPVVGRAGVLLPAGADKGPALDARDVVDGGAMEQAARELLGVESFHLAGRESLVAQLFELGLAAVDPNNLVGFYKRLHLLNPVEDILVVCHDCSPLGVFGIIYKNHAGMRGNLVGFLWSFPRKSKSPTFIIIDRTF